MIVYENCLLPEFVWTDQDLDFFLEQKGEAGKFWRLVYKHYCDKGLDALLEHMNKIQRLLILAKLQKYPAAHLKLTRKQKDEYEQVYLWDSDEMLFTRIACKAIGIEEAFLIKLNKTAQTKFLGLYLEVIQTEPNWDGWNTLTSEFDAYEKQLDFDAPFDIDLTPRQHTWVIYDKIHWKKYNWYLITYNYAYEAIDFLISIIHDKECKKEILEDINRLRNNNNPSDMFPY